MTCLHRTVGIAWGKGTGNPQSYHHFPGPVGLFLSPFKLAPLGKVGAGTSGVSWVQRLLMDIQE